MNHQQHYRKNGYTVVGDCFSETQLEPLHHAIKRLHSTWLKDNQQAYEEGLINSAYLTRKSSISNPQQEEDINTLFQWIADESIIRHLRAVFPQQFAFMNSQLFFDPFETTQKNYWHRDPQYHLSLDEQKLALEKQTVIHCRIPLVDEPGIELVPGSHKNWDTEEELNVRCEKNGRQRHDDLSSGHTIPLKRGDLLIFSANMIHRGLYGRNRLALDLLYCDREPELLSFVDPRCLPSEKIRAQLENPAVFVAPPE